MVGVARGLLCNGVHAARHSLQPRYSRSLQSKCNLLPVHDVYDGLDKRLSAGRIGLADCRSFTRWLEYCIN